MKKILVNILLLSFINLISCYSVSEVSKEEFLESKNSDAHLLTGNLEKFHFNHGNYYVKSDTIRGIGEREFKGINFPFKGSIPLDSVNNFQIEYVDGWKTFGLVIGVTVLLLIVAGTVVAESFISVF